MLEKKHKYETPINSDHYQNEYPQIFSTIIDQTTKIFYGGQSSKHEQYISKDNTKPPPPPNL